VKERMQATGRQDGMALRPMLLFPEVAMLLHGSHVHREGPTPTFCTFALSSDKHIPCHALRA
jgi:hypothetical protein